MSLRYLIMAFLWKAGTRIIDKILKHLLEEEDSGNDRTIKIGTRIIDKILKHLLEEEDSGNDRTISLAILIVIVIVIVMCYLASLMGCITTSLRRELSRKISTVSEDISTVRTDIRVIRNDMIHAEWNTATGFYQDWDALDHPSNGRLHKF